MLVVALTLSLVSKYSFVMSGWSSSIFNDSGSVTARRRAFIPSCNKSEYTMSDTTYNKEECGEGTSVVVLRDGVAAAATDC